MIACIQVRAIARMFALAMTCGALACSPSNAAKPVTPHAPAPARFDYVGQDWLRFEARVGDTSTRLMLDTGGGVTLLSKKLCEKVGCVPDGTFTGKRMSGQALTIPMARVESIVMAGHAVKNARVAVLDTASLLHPDLGVDGIAGLDLFRDCPFTIDYGSHELVLEDESSLAVRRAAGEVVSVRVENDGPATVVFMPLQLEPNASPLQMEVDNGSRDLILDERFMMTLGIAKDAAGVKQVDGQDETEHGYTRWFTSMPRPARVPGTLRVGVSAGATVMFQKIIHDGLVGHAFLSGHVTTYDLARGQMIFGPLR
jgi:hypothetical protein